MYDVIIIGKGPAGISCSLYTARANLKTLIIGKESWLARAQNVDNYYGFEQSISGMDLLKKGEEQAKRFDVEIIEDEVVSIKKEENFIIKTPNQDYNAKSVLIATGKAPSNINITNLSKFEGKGIHYCSTCDGFYYNGAKVGVIGNKDYAISESMELLNYTKDITIFTNGQELEVSEKFSDKIGDFFVNTRKIKNFNGEDYLKSITFTDGTISDVDGVFIATKSASSIDFARKLGILTKEDLIVVDNRQETNQKGIFAAGDCTSNLKQISTAVGFGAIAGKSIIEFLKKE